MVQDRINELIEIINKASYEYYVLDNPTLTDQEYDDYYMELLALEKKFPEYVRDREKLITKTDVLHFDYKNKKVTLQGKKKGQDSYKVIEDTYASIDSIESFDDCEAYEYLWEKFISVSPEYIEWLESHNFDKNTFTSLRIRFKEDHYLISSYSDFYAVYDIEEEPEEEEIQYAPLVIDELGIEN